MVGGEDQCGVALVVLGIEGEAGVDEGIEHGQVAATCGIEIVALQLRLERCCVIGRRLPGNPAQRPAGQQRADEGTH